MRNLQQAAAVMVVALGTEDPDAAAELATTAIALADTADALSQEAWRTYRNALVAAG